MNRELLWVLAAAIFGLAVLPWLVHLVGVQTLGPYAHGGSAAFLRDFYVDLLHLRPAALTLAVGPALLLLTWRAMLRGSRGTRSRDSTAGNGSRDSA
jgi:hypothetical protein